MNATRWRSRRRAGFSLFETMVAMFVMLIGLLGIFSAFAAGMNARLMAQEMVMSQELATMWADWVRFRCRDSGGPGGLGIISTTDLASGILNQPEPHYSYHRPIHVLVREAASAGFVVDAMEEPTFPPGVGAKSAFAWAKRPEVPPALVVRMRPKPHEDDGNERQPIPR